MIDAKRYPKAKPKGLVSIVERDNVFFICYKRFDVRDGSEVESEFQQINIDEITERKKLLEEELNGINEVFSDLETLKNPTE
jgi:hypothetical protein